MNLIEKLGGYDKAKAHRDYLIDFGNEFNRPNKFEVDKLNDALLQYRRENNIFEVGDLVVHPKFDNKKIYEIIKIKGDLFTVFYDRNSHSFRSDLRHATPEEIKAGYRL